MLARDYKVRVLIVLLMFGVLFCIIALRLFLVQIYQIDFFRDLAKNQYALEITLDPARAIIYDRTGKVPLAFNRHVQSAFIVPNQLAAPEKIKPFLKKYYPETYKRLLSAPNKQFLWLERKLAPTKYAFIQAQGMKDIHFIDEHQRYYPYRSASQVIGLTDIDNAGIAGIELAFSKKLAGQPSSFALEKDARSGAFYFKKELKKRGKNGESVQLTLDSVLQSVVYDQLQETVKELQAKGGSVIVINPDNGHIYAMANYPSFDPKDLNISLDMMKNSSICECYELGSVMKAFCALAALAEGVVGFDEIIDCEGRYAMIDGFKVENPTLSLLRLLEEKNNQLPFCDVIRYSSNVGVAKVAKRLGPKLYTHLRMLGFGSKTDIQFPGERSGFVNPPARWSRSSIIVMSFGYEIMASLLQLAKAFSIVANGGYDVQPTLLPTTPDPDKRERLYRDQPIAQMKTIFEKVCEKYPIEGFRVMGKTGTARCVKNGRYSNKDHHYTFAGIIERGNYRRVVISFVREPAKASLWASEVALPLFNKIAHRMITHDMAHKILEKV